MRHPQIEALSEAVESEQGAVSTVALGLGDALDVRLERSRLIYKDANQRAEQLSRRLASKYPTEYNFNNCGS